MDLMTLIQARKWAFEQLARDYSELPSERAPKAEALAQWLINGYYDPPIELPIGDKGLS